ncbi:hypothetical protein P9272_34090, partial [Mesorhizobium sp. WSM4976]|uniref:hypothetical protein n=1 Tax=Mesorhizobium sp. WSM4976 TaxID=3038549 RepID=UPI002416A524
LLSLQRAKSVTHLSGMNCHPSLGKGINDLVDPDKLRKTADLQHIYRIRDCSGPVLMVAEIALRRMGYGKDEVTAHGAPQLRSRRLHVTWGQSAANFTEKKIDALQSQLYWRAIYVGDIDARVYKQLFHTPCGEGVLQAGQTKSNKPALKAGVMRMNKVDQSLSETTLRPPGRTTLRASAIVSCPSRGERW